MMPQSARRAARVLLRIAVILALAFGAVRLLAWVDAQSHGAADNGTYLLILALMLIAYAALIAVPFVPGIEIGLAILMMQGPVAAPAVYLATLTGLMAAYLAGRFLPEAFLRGFFADLGLRGPVSLIDRIAPLSPVERIAMLRERLPGRLAHLALGWRYLILAAVLNVPGNWLLGGGGGIMMVAGLSGLFRPLATAIAIALAVAPVPLAIWAFDLKIL